MARRRHSGGARDFPRTARVNELLREILGDELERIDDSRLEWVSVTAVDVNPELSGATVYYSSLGGEEADPEVLEALAEHRVRLQAAIGRQARLRRTPELHFKPDSGVRTGLRVEELLAELAEEDGPPPGSAD
jgi:ribosome-binding factor A